MFVVLGDSYDLDTHSWNPDGIRVIRQQDFWFAFGMTVLCVSLPLFCTRSTLSLRDRANRFADASSDRASILIPWFTVREVKVDIEVVSALVLIEPGLPPRTRPTDRSSIFFYSATAAVTEGRHPALRAGYAAGPPRPDIALLHHGVPRVRDHLVSLSVSIVRSSEA